MKFKKNQKVLNSLKIFRHGERTPVLSYPTDPHHCVEDWPVGWGELTNIGKMQLYRLGEWLGQKYTGHLLNATYLENEIYVQSSDQDRSIQSAYCLLAGLYPPKNEQIWNDGNLLWQPIPVHTIANRYDSLLIPVLQHCPLFDVYMAELYTHPDIIKMYEDNRDFYEYVAEHSGFPPGTIRHYFIYTVLLRDNLKMQDVYLKP